MAPRPSSRRSDGNLGIGLILLFIVGVIGACVHSTNLNNAKSTPQVESGETGTPSRME